MGIKTRIIRIGNSQGIRIPKAVLDQLALKDEVELEVVANQLIVRPVSYPRQGWEAQFETMAASGDDALLDADMPSPARWDDEEWEW